MAANLPIPHSDLPIRLPRKALAELQRMVVPSGLPPDTEIELIIKINDVNLNVRDFAAYLNFVDRAYGRLISADLKSYAQRPYRQLIVDSTRTGSIELIIKTLVENLDVVTALLVLRLLLKLLPEAYLKFEQGRFTRMRRMQLREKMQHDRELEALERRRQNQLIELMDHLYQREQRYLPRAKRFSLSNVIDVVIRFVQRKDSR